MDKKLVITALYNEKKPIKYEQSLFKEKDGGMYMNFTESIITQIVKARNEDEFKAICERIQEFIEREGIDICFAINQNELLDCLDEHKKLKLQIADLEAKLAEKNELFIATKWKVDDLEKQLAENERKYEALYKLFSEQHEIIDQYELECFEEVNRLLKEQKDFYVVEKDEYDKMVAGAKQFAKETAIAELEKVKVKLNEEINNASVLLDPVEYEDYHELLGVIRGYKLSVDQIDQQIKSLKGEK